MQSKYHPTLPVSDTVLVAHLSAISGETSATLARDRERMNPNHLPSHPFIGAIDKFIRRKTRFLGSTFCFAASLYAAPAQAIDAPGAVGSASVNIVLMGSITANCSIGGGGNIPLGEIAGDRQAVARFDIGCNVPFELVFRSASGGIAHVGKPEGEGPYAGIVPYRLGITVPAHSPEPVQLHADFTSAQLVGGGILNSGDAIAAGGGEIRVQTEMSQGRELLAGQYADSITIMINPRL